MEDNGKWMKYSQITSELLNYDLIVYIFSNVNIICIVLHT